VYFADQIRQKWLYQSTIAFTLHEQMIFIFIFSS